MIDIGRPPRERSAHPVYENVAALRLAFAADLAKSDVFKTLGYYVAGDGGGNEYDYDSGSSATEDNGFVITPNGGVGRFLAVNKTIANVDQFGANGTTDSATFIAALNTGVPVVGHRTAYDLSDHSAHSTTVDIDLTLRKDCVVTGPGNGVDHFLSVTEGDSVKIHGGDWRAWDAVVYLPAPTVQHESIEIQNSKCSNSFGLTDDIGTTTLLRVKQFVVQGCTITNVRFGISCRAQRFDKCLISGNHITAVAMTADSAIGINIGGNSSTGNDSGDIVIRDNYIDDVTSTSATHDTHCIIAYGRFIKVIDNYTGTCSNAGGVANTSNSESIYTKSYGALVNGNTCFNGGRGEGTINCKGLEVGAGSATPPGHTCKILNNHVLRDDGLLPEAAISSRDRTLIQGNTIEGGGAGIKAIFHHCVINANHLIEGAGTLGGIIVSGCDYTMVTNNKFIDWGQATGTVFDLQVIANTNPMLGLVIQGNTFRSQNDATSNRAIQFSNTQNITATIALNDFDNYHRVFDGDTTTLRWMENTVRNSTTVILDAQTDMFFTGEWTGVPAFEANVGSVVRRTDGGAGTTIYIKEATGTTWVPHTGFANLVEDATPELGGALDGKGEDLNNLGVAFLTQQAAAEADVTDKGQIWVKTATPNQLWFTDDAGNDFHIDPRSRAYGGISAEGNATATTISGSDTAFGANAVQIVTFGTNNSESLNVTPDHTSDHLTVDLDGTYLGSLSMSITGTAADVVSFSIFKNNKGTQMCSRATITLTGNVDQVSLDPCPMPLVDTDTIEVWIQNETAGRNVTMQDGSFHIHRID